jgi:hypothetical protein
MATSGVVLYASGRWHHTPLRWWGALLRQWGYRGRLPGWAWTTCEAVFPMPSCRCKMYQLVWEEDPRG